MFLELNRMKEEVSYIKTKTGISTNPLINNNTSSNDFSGPKMVLGNNAGLGGGLMGLKDPRRIEH